MEKVFPVSTHHPSLFGVYWWWLLGSLCPCVNQLRGSSFSSMYKTNSCRFSAGGRTQLSSEGPNVLFLGKLGFSVEAEEAQLPISHSNAVKTAMKEICDNVQSSMIAKQKNLKGHQNFVWEAEKARHASSLDKIPSVQAILNLNLEMENKLPAPRCKTIKLADFLKDCRGQNRYPCTHQSRYWSPSVSQLATMAMPILSAISAFWKCTWKPIQLLEMTVIIQIQERCEKTYQFLQLSRD